MCVFSYSDSKYANQLQHIGSMKMDNQGVRLSDFAKSDGHSTDQLRSVITRNDVPFIPDVEEAKAFWYVKSPTQKNVFRTFPHILPA